MKRLITLLLFTFIFASVSFGEDYHIPERKPYMFAPGTRIADVLMNIDMDKMSIDGDCVWYEPDNVYLGEYKVDVLRFKFENKVLEESDIYFSNISENQCYRIINTLVKYNELILHDARSVNGVIILFYITDKYGIMFALHEDTKDSYYLTISYLS